MYIHDVLIVGAGPAGLGVAARLREDTPSATFTDDEHQRYLWIRKHGRKMNVKNYRTNKDSLPTPPLTPESSECGCESHESPNDDIDMLVLDADGADWMSKWKRLFKTFDIDYLRSPMFFHVDPSDRDALLGYAYEQQREQHLMALPGCAGKEISKHKKKKKISSKGRFLGRTPDVDERDRKDYFVPRTDLFDDHCAAIIRRYGLGKNMVQQERALNIEYDEVSAFGDAEHDSVISSDGSDDLKNIFRVTTDKGYRYASVLVLAIGPGNAPSIPNIPNIVSEGPHEGFSHAMQIKQFPPPHVWTKIKNRQPTSMLIVGGGLTSIQLADLALRRGVSKIWLLMRGPIKVKYFDVDLDWVGKFRNYKQAGFWTADTDEERMEMIAQARNGGSMTPRYRKILETHIGSGKIILHTHTTLTSANWDGSTKSWDCKISVPEVLLPAVDFIVFATGIQSDIRKLPFLQTIRQKHPIEYIGGMPCLNNDMMWNDEVPLFVTGRFAGLRLGPGAPNLVGARVGAERIAWNVEAVLKGIGRARSKKVFYESPDESSDEKMNAYAAARNNRFESLLEMEGA
ncbi:hypothetical protein IQ07DRAFT_557519 [Pyrenochaeta sp. DS3sAY3a]|nr:hypothetical protein IQ07DRAFT_557519 [Pyrenochaeta sp. DS3sAY3a]